MQNLYDSSDKIYETIGYKNLISNRTEEIKMTAQTLNEMNHNDFVWQIKRLQKNARLKNVIRSVVNQRSCH